MSNTISLEELKNLSLPCLPKNLESIRYRAKTQDWPYIEEVGKARGGRLKKYLIASLPAEIRAAIMKRQSDELAEKMPKMLPQVRPGTAMSAQALAEAAKLLNEKQRSVADARCAVVAAVLGIKYQYGCSAKAAVAQFLGLLAEGKLDAVTLGNLEKANDRSRSAKVGERTLDGWISAYLKAENATERLVALAPKTTKAVKPIESYGWLPMFMQFHNIPSAPKLAHSYRRFVQWAEAENMPVNDVPNLSMVRRVWDKLPLIMQERGRKTGAAYKSLLPYVKRDWGALKPNDVWIGDGHSFKAKVAHPVHGRPFKPEVTVIIDGCTRFVVGFSVSLAESCVAVSDALRIGVKHFGLPIIYYSDSNLAEVKKFNEAFIAVAKSADETFGGPFLEDKAGLYQCTNAANAAYDYFTARQNQNAMVANYKQNYDNAMAACKEQIKHPPEAEATVYARKGINLPINDCLAVLTGDEPFDTFTCPMKIK